MVVNTSYIVEQAPVPPDRSGVSPNQAWPVRKWKQDVAIPHFLWFYLFKDVNSQWIEYVETFDRPSIIQ